MEKISIQTIKQVEFIDITDKIQSLVSRTGIEDGIGFVFIPHTTAGITINENADPNVCTDIINQLNKMVSLDNDYLHLEGNSAAHIKASLLGFSATIFINKSRLRLGTWQGIYFAEFDGPRMRNIFVKFLTQPTPY